MTSRTHHRGAAGDWPGQPASGASPVEPATDAGAELERLRAELEAAQAQTSEHLASLQRTAADFANFRRGRPRIGSGNWVWPASRCCASCWPWPTIRSALEAMPADLRGAGWIEGIVLLDRKLRQLLESEGVTPIEVIGRPSTRTSTNRLPASPPGPADGKS